MNRCNLHTDKVAEPHVRGCSDCDRELDEMLHAPGNPDSFGFPEWHSCYEAYVHPKPVTISPTAQAFLNELEEIDV